MKTPDVNVLLYAINDDSPQQRLAREWLETAFAEPAGIGFAWVALLGFLRLATRPGIFPKPLGVEDALSLVDDWLNHPHSRVLNPTDRHAALLARLLLALDTNELDPEQQQLLREVGSGVLEVHGLPAYQALPAPPDDERSSYVRDTTRQQALSLLDSLLTTRAGA